MVKWGEIQPSLLAVEIWGGNSGRKWRTACISSRGGLGVQRALTRKKLRQHQQDGHPDFEGERHAEAEGQGQGDGGQQAVPDTVALAKNDQGPIGCGEGHPQAEAPQTTDRSPTESVLLNPRNLFFLLSFLPSLSQPREEESRPEAHGDLAEGPV